MRLKNIHFILILITFLLSFFSVVYSQTTPEELSKVKPLRGFVKRISGDTIDYNCFNPLARVAMLTRCTDGKMKIEWETEPVPANFKGDYAYYIFVVSYSTTTSSGDRNFDFYINNQKYFNFKTYKNRNEKLWNMKAEDGTELTFNLVQPNLHNDANGYMYLKVPISKYKKSEPLTLKVVGEKASANDWFMTFMYDMRENSVEILPLPLLTEIDKKIHQVVFVGINYLGSKGKAIVSIDGGKEQKSELNLGFNNFEFFIPAIEKDKEIKINVLIDNKFSSTTNAILKPVTKRNIYLIPHSHNDIGYTDLQPDVLKKQVKNIYDALELIKKTEKYPADSRFKWNVEVLWGVESFLETADEVKKKDFINAVKNGSIGLQGLYLNMLTGIMRPEEFYKLTEYSRKIKEIFGIDIKSAMISDVPGMTWNIIPTLAQSGIKYFSCGPNGVYSGGDRTGYTNSKWADRPFYWVSPSGNEKILYWMTGFGYGSIFSGISPKNRNRLDYLKNFKRYFEWLDDISYPYNMIHMRHTVNGDNGTVDSSLSDNAKEWNEKYVSPKFIIATSEQVFEEFEKKHGSSLPTYSGDMTPYWEDGASSTAYELGLTRNTSEKLVQAEALYSMIGPDKYDENKFYDAWKNVLLFDEHTWGAWNSTSEPDLPFVDSQWKIKQQFAIDASNQANNLLNNILLTSPKTREINFFDVINTNSWQRTDLVLIPESQSSNINIIKDEEGKEITSQRLSNGDLAFIAQNIPPFGSKKYSTEKGNQTVYQSELKIENNQLSGNNIQIVLNPKTGSISSLTTKNPKIEFADNSKSMGLNEYLYVSGLDSKEAQSVINSKLRINENGPVVCSFFIESDAPGCNNLKREIRLIDGLKRIDIINTIDKKKIREKESLHFAFPFNIPDGIVRMDLGFGVIRPESDQLPGSCKDYYSVQRWVDVSNQNYGLTWTLNEAPLVEVGEMHNELPSPNRIDWKKIQSPSTTIFSYVMNNYWYTNYKADQEGISTYNYSIYPHGLYNQGNNMKIGIERSQPLIVRQISKENPKLNSFFTLSSNDIIVTYLKPTNKGNGYIVRLYNASGRPSETKIILQDNSKSIYLSSPFENKGEKIEIIKIPADGLITLRIE